MRIKNKMRELKMPVDLRVILKLIGEYFQDPQKVVLWLRTPNALLGDIAPYEMIRIGRYKKLLKFVQTALRDNER